MSTNHYATAIEIIFKQEYDANSIAMQLAKQHPALFVSMVRKPVVDKDQQIRNMIVKCLGSDAQRNYVAAIKLYRELVGASLTEAVHYVRTIKESML